MPADRDPLALDEQVCFALAVAARSVIAAYKPALEPLGLTHPQYLVMLALWQDDGLGLSELSATLSLDPGTASPLVKRLEQMGFVERVRSPHDQRSLQITLTEDGRALRSRALDVPTAMLERLGMTEDDLDEANALLHRIIAAAHAAG
ncbi:MarR family transcriptional regulator [Aeromicrobium sp. PE09-221]|uniref:MarR family winged helix-turn-helix transcriptional regulator n=1 Tax=Aeromicrobium sp. PE09-221 TaxID=1898043 RepID=UPI000B3EC260|nr:MarR family transcriptional regulator [Aeromicrobium sp. PE09-221]OUZ12120.1 MarR family transcriptional regulator [Aeromicrobium sp. PE09-221]